MSGALGVASAVDTPKTPLCPYPTSARPSVMLFLYLLPVCRKAHVPNLAGCWNVARGTQVASQALGAGGDAPRGVWLPWRRISSFCLGSV